MLTAYSAISQKLVDDPKTTFKKLKIAQLKKSSSSFSQMMLQPQTHKHQSRIGSSYFPQRKAVKRMFMLKPLHLIWQNTLLLRPVNIFQDLPFQELSSKNMLFDISTLISWLQMVRNIPRPDLKIKSSICRKKYGSTKFRAAEHPQHHKSTEKPSEVQIQNSENSIVS